MKKGFVYLVGAGPGDPELVTVKALNALAGADCIIYDHLANPAIIEPYTCEKIYVGKKGSQHTLPQEEITGLIIRKAREGMTVVRLKGGDPYIFGRGGEEAEMVAREGIAFSVVPGVSSFHSAPAYAGIPLTHRDYSNAIEVITGHRRGDAPPGKELNFPDYDPDKTFLFLMGVKNFPVISAGLIKEKNFPGHTPVAVISWGTTPRQKVVTGMLSGIAGELERQGITPPSIIVVGRVVNLREKLRWFDTLPLFGKKIVVTRTRSQASALTKKLAALGAMVIEFPTIDVRPLEDLSPLDGALERIRDFDWIYFTSQNAIQIFFDRLFKKGLDVRSLGNMKIAVIGPATRDELARYGLRHDAMPKEYVAESLLEESRALGLRGKRVILPCSEDARAALAEGLAQMGALVERIHIYGAGRPEELGVDKREEIMNSDVVTFTSSSTAKNFFGVVPAVKASLACIGPVTAKTVKELGHQAHMTASEYTIDGLVTAIVDYYGKK